MATLTHLMGIGGVTDTKAKWRARADSACVLKIEYSTASDLTGSTQSTGVSVVTGDDFTGGEELTGLAANTTYYYSILVDGVRAHSSPFPRFKTFPTEGTPATVTVVWSSCRDNGNEATIFDSIAAESPNVVIDLGDFGYPETIVLANYRTNYKSQHAPVASDDYVRAIVPVFPVARVYDDHDYGVNNSDGDSAGKANAMQAWKEYTAYYDLPNAANGIWHDFKLAHCHFFMTDGRSQREGTQVRFPTSSTITADTGSSGSTLVLRAADSPSASDDNYNGYYVKITTTSGTYIERVTDYVGATRTCTLSRSVPNLTSTSTYALKKASVLDMDFIANNQVDWLVNGLNNSTARWKFICSPSAMNATTTVLDEWGAWDTENLEQTYLSQHITDLAHTVVISGDIHAVGADTTNSLFKEVTASPLNRGNESISGTWSLGKSQVAGHAYGVLTAEGSWPYRVTLTCKDTNGSQISAVSAMVLAEGRVRELGTRTTDGGAPGRVFSVGAL